MQRVNAASKAYRTQRKAIRNHFWTYRKRMGYGQKRVAFLLGHKTTAHISDYERGKRLPNLETALKLEIALRVPVSFLYKDLYERFKKEIRHTEEQLKLELQDQPHD